MWKESYRLGIEEIDSQHIELFQMVDDLLKAIDTDEKWEKKEQYSKAITFMKNYVVRHFQEEEAYQSSVGYKGLESHKKLHNKFTKTVLDYEKKFLETNYERGIVKDFAGMLTAWLIYHVADADQKIAGNNQDVLELENMTYLECFTMEAVDVLEKMVGCQPGDLTEQETVLGLTSEDIVVRIDLSGDLEGTAVFGYPKETAFAFLKAMIFSEVNEIDELLCSALAEISNIISGRAATMLTKRGVACDIGAPSVTVNKEESLQISQADSGVIMNSSMGGFKILLQN